MLPYIPSQEPIPITERPSFDWLSFTLFVLILGVALGGSYYWYRQPEVKPKVNATIKTVINWSSETIKSLRKNGQAVADKIHYNQSVAQTAALASTAQPVFTKMDETWQLYTNSQLGFSLKIPRFTYVQLTCSQQLQPTKEVVTTFEDGSSVYIAPTKIPSCEGEAPNSLNELKKETRPWLISTVTVKSDKELDEYIKKTFGIGCRAGNRIEMAQTGVFDIYLEADGRYISQNSCPASLSWQVFYIPEKQKIFTWDMGQKSSFFGKDPSEIYDTQMQSSFTAL